MRHGVMFPHELGIDVGAIREFTQAVEDLGYSSLVVSDNILGVDPKSHPGWDKLFTRQNIFHEPLVLIGYLSAITERVNLIVGVLVLPERQTVLVAKQTAELDVLSGGRLSLGVGLGWNQVEYEALGQSFHARGSRCEEQIAVLKALWTQVVVDFQGTWHRIKGAGLNPLPLQRPIPIWFGGHAKPMLRRIARIGAGWPGHPYCIPQLVRSP